MISFNLTKKDKIKNFLKNLTNKYSKSYFSQEGEDKILDRIFEHSKQGFYIDIGAHHPKRFSNTYFFYQKGWNGINIDAKPGSMNDFNIFRRKDINIEAAISDEDKSLTYFSFSDSALNTFDSSAANRIEKEGFYKIIDKININTQKLGDLLTHYFPKGRDVNFMSIDVEGLDINVLRSNNWSLFKPEVILVEDLNFKLDSPKESEVYSYLKSMDYELFSKCVNTLIFKKVE